MSTADSRVRALLADDQVVAVRGAQVYLAALGVEVCGTIDDPRRLVSTYLELEPDLAIVEATTGGRGAMFGEVAALLAKAPTAAVLVLTADLSPVVVESALEHGCLGVVPKTCSVDALGVAVRAVAAGDRHLHPRALAALLQLRQSSQQERIARPLSPRETAVLERIAEGMTNLEIAADLGIASDTVKTHIARSLEKLGARDRTHAVSRAMRIGLIR